MYRAHRLSRACGWCAQRTLQKKQIEEIERESGVDKSVDLIPHVLIVLDVAKLLDID